jgi:hypothetical protein
MARSVGRLRAEVTEFFAPARIPAAAAEAAAKAALTAHEFLGLRAYFSRTFPALTSSSTRGAPSTSSR